MATLREIIESYGPISDEQAEWLASLTADWQVIADLSFADLIMWREVDGGFVAVAHCRPSTGPTVHQDDVVGSHANPEMIPKLVQAYREGVRTAAVHARDDETYAVREDAFPIVKKGQIIAVLTREVSQAVSRSSSRLELNYKGAADDLLGMITRGEFPVQTSVTGPRRGAPRVGDGVMRLDARGVVTYASPNAMSCFHRLGVIEPLINRSLPKAISDVIADKGRIDETLAMVAMGRAAWRTDVEAGGACLSLRAIPVTVEGERKGAIILCRDVSELRRRERELITKDATIREIHHRVKNNLQTVAALLRLQSRRVTAPEAKEALSEAMRRVSTIAMVHETLSGTLDELVNFDDLASRSVRMAAEVASPAVQARVIQEGDFGLIPAGSASPLALVITELVTNAVEHGFAGREHGTITLTVNRTGAHLSLVISDDGNGLQGAPGGLGAQIVRTLVENELYGAIDWIPGAHGGTEVHVTAELINEG